MFKTNRTQWKKNLEENIGQLTKETNTLKVSLAEKESEIKRNEEKHDYEKEKINQTSIRIKRFFQTKREQW